MGVNFFTHRIKLQIKFLPQPELLPAERIFTVITEVWPRANRAVVTNNSIVIIEVVLIDVMLIEGFLYCITRRVVMAEVNRRWVRGMPRLGWMEGMKVALGKRNDGGDCATMHDR